jgi:hypothetical protein
MDTLDTDYLVIGAGAVGLAFADTLAHESTAQILVVDRRGTPGGHWNDAYGFVTLHQPSAFYGVASLPLGGGRIDRVGLNAGFHELASGAEVSGYFDRVVRQSLLPTGRVSWRPMCEVREVDGEPRLVSLLTGQETRVRVRRRVVDATYYGTTIPATHTPGFAVAEGARRVPPNALPGLWQARQADSPLPSHFVVLGAGKTAMDTVLWLLQSGLPPERITWVMPRDSWLLNRRVTQPGLDFFADSFGSQAAQMEALARSQTVDEVFERLEAEQVMLRIDPSRRPTMFHYATVAEAEVAELRRVTQVLRLGRVQRVEPGALVFDTERVPVPEDSLFIDCTASAVERRPSVPLFQPGRLVLQMVRIPQPAFSAALVAHLEARALASGDAGTPESDAACNALCAPVPLPDTLDGYPRATMVNMANQMQWGRDRELRTWIRQCRLDGFGQLVEQVAPDDEARQAVLARLGTAARQMPFAAARWMAP